MDTGITGHVPCILLSRNRRFCSFLVLFVGYWCLAVRSHPDSCQVNLFCNLKRNKAYGKQREVDLCCLRVLFSNPAREQWPLFGALKLGERYLTPAEVLRDCFRKIKATEGSFSSFVFCSHDPRARVAVSRILTRAPYYTLYRLGLPYIYIPIGLLYVRSEFLYHTRRNSFHRRHKNQTKK